MGTFDISILNLSSGMFEVLSTNGDTHLGGDDFDKAVIDWLVSTFKSDTSIDLSKDPMAMQRLKEAAEKAKIELSSTTSTEINLPYISVLDGVPQHLVKTLTRAQFETLINDIVNKAIEPCKKAIKDSGLSVSEIDEVLLVGGSTRVPIVQKIAKDIFGKEPSKNINPDECVAMGAAIQGAILNREEGVNEMVLLDVTPISMGIQASEMYNPEPQLVKIIEGNTTIPCKKEKEFTTAQDNQTAVTINILQGERSEAKYAKSIGVFNLEGIAPAPAGTPKILVTFDIDADGILNVTAKDKATGKEQKVTIQKQSMSDEEIAAMKADADAHSEEDKKRAEMYEKINVAHSYTDAVKRAIEDEQMKALFTDADKEKLTPLVEAVETELKSFETSEDKEIALQRIENAKKALEDVYNPIISKAYGNNDNAANMFNQFGADNPFDNVK